MMCVFEIAFVCDRSIDQSEESKNDVQRYVDPNMNCHIL